MQLTCILVLQNQTYQPKFGSLCLIKDRLYLFSNIMFISFRIFKWIFMIIKLNEIWNQTLKSEARVKDGSGNPTLFSVDCSAQPDRVYKKLRRTSQCPKRRARPKKNQRNPVKSYKTLEENCSKSFIFAFNCNGYF